MSERYIVIADPPTPNGDLHVGHLSGPYFAADVMARSLRLQGHSVAFFSNVDPHQTYVVTAGRRLGLEPEEVAAKFRQRILGTLEADAIELDLFGHPEPGQHAFVRRFFQTLLEAGKLRVKDEEMPYCSGCQQFLFEAYLEGVCPHCGSGCYGNGCEVCGLPNHPKDMGKRRCRLCREETAELRTYRGLFLPLERYQEEVRSHLESRRGIWRQSALDRFLEASAGELPDIPLSYVSDYGLPVDLPGFEGQVFNVRLEILPALLHTFERWREAQGAGAWHWREPPGARVLHFHGTENGFQYAVSFNSLLVASDEGWDLPYANITNEFYLLDQQKFSTTRNHAVWGGEILAQVPSDALRFYLALTNPEEEESNFVVAEFRDETDRLLVEPWNRLHSALGTGPGRRAEARNGGARQDTFLAEMEEAYRVESFSLRRAAAALSHHLGELAEAAERPEAATTDLSVGLRAWTLAAGPLLPRFAARLQSELGLEGRWAEVTQDAPGLCPLSEDLRMSPLGEAL
jgi:methionyl-tRNA synthetase